MPFAGHQDVVIAPIAESDRVRGNAAPEVEVVEEKLVDVRRNVCGGDGGAK